MLQTPLCRQLGMQYPLFSVGMGGGMAGPELAAAVSNAGACGVLGMGGLPAPYIWQQIHHLRTLTNKPFGVNLLLPLRQEGQIEACLDEQIPIEVTLMRLYRYGKTTVFSAKESKAGQGITANSVSLSCGAVLTFGCQNAVVHSGY